jgi:hypothetical protein
LADPPATVGELAAALDVPLDDIVATGMWAMGSFITDRFSATYEWDMYHEHPVASAADLARRRLTGYHVHATGEHYPPAPPAVDPQERLAQNAPVRRLGPDDVVRRICVSRAARSRPATAACC